MTSYPVIPCPKCGLEIRIGDWPMCPHGNTHSHDAAVHHKERAVKYYHPQYGWRTPGRADRPMPGRLAELGFQRVEFDSLQSLDNHARETGSRAEIADFSPGSSTVDRIYDQRKG
jgi:hypothetical protein